MNGLKLCVHTPTIKPSILYSHTHTKTHIIIVNSVRCLCQLGNAVFLVVVSISRYCDSFYNVTLLSSSSFNRSNSNRNIHNDDFFSLSICSWKHINSNIAWGYSLSRSTDAFHSCMREEKCAKSTRKIPIHMVKVGMSDTVSSAEWQYNLNWQSKKANAKENLFI